MDDFEQGPFASLYQEWLDAYPEPRDPAIEKRLAEVYRQAWATGDADERESVLYFVMNRESYMEDQDLILDGLASEDFRVAKNAAPIVSAAKSLEGVDFGPDLIEIWRNAVLRHPILDLNRDANLRRPGDGWPEGRPFMQLYEEWMSDEYPRNLSLEERLSNLYARTWETGDAVDKAFVLKFLGYRHKPRTDWILEGIQSEHYGLAYAALFEASIIMVRDGHDLGSDLLRLVDEHEQRFPQTSRTIAHIIRFELKNRGKLAKQ